MEDNNQICLTIGQIQAFLSYLKAPCVFQSPFDYILNVVTGIVKSKLQFRYG